jgi:hypothetical protein
MNMSNTEHPTSEHMVKRLRDFANMLEHDGLTFRAGDVGWAANHIEALERKCAGLLEAAERFCDSSRRYADEAQHLEREIARLRVALEG